MEEELRAQFDERRQEIYDCVRRVEDAIERLQTERSELLSQLNAVSEAQISSATEIVD